VAAKTDGGDREGEQRGSRLTQRSNFAVQDRLELEAAIGKRGLVAMGRAGERGCRPAPSGRLIPA
jgi:hypothetical protein